MKIQFIAVAILAAATLTSCKKDKENPTILITSPANHAHFESGDHIEASATFEDDQALKSYHVHVGDEEGNHSHDWSYSDEGELTGTSFEWKDDLHPPDSLPMMLYLHFEVSDEEGKVTNDKVMMHF